MSTLALPRAAQALVGSFAAAFTKPSYLRLLTLLVGAIVTGGRRTVTRILWTVRSLACGHPSSYHRFFSRARWKIWPLARVLATAVLTLIPADQPAALAADDTVAQHRGKKVYGKACHRDAVRSAWGKLVHKWGHRWVVVAVLVKFGFAKRPWALPVLCALYRPPALDKHEGLRHKTPSQLARQLVAALMHWFPQRRFILLGDGHFSGIALADFARRHCWARKGQRRVTLIGRLRARTALYARPPKRRNKHRPGRRAIKGRKLCPLCRQVERARPARLTVRWYGNSKRAVDVVGGAGIWYRCGLYSSVRWVCVHDPVGKRTDYFYSTDQAMSPRKIIELFAARWSIEVTFQEMREHLGWETTRQRVKASVLRSAPLLMGCYSVVTLVFARYLHSRPGCEPVGGPLRTYHKGAATFSDAIGTVRRLLWDRTILDQALTPACVAQCPRRLKTLLLDQLAAAA